MFKLITIILLLRIMASICQPEGVVQGELFGDVSTANAAIVQTKEFVLGIFFQANWYRASQFCRYHGLHLASIDSRLEHETVVGLIADLGLTSERFWISGNNLASQGQFFWMANGQPFTYTNWFAGEPNNIGSERCVELWNGNSTNNPILWNNSICTYEKYFVCEKFA